MNALLWAVRESVEAAASDFEIEPEPLLSIDIHTASSLLQKSIRRADTQLTLSGTDAIKYDSVFHGSAKQTAYFSAVSL